MGEINGVDRTQRWLFGNAFESTSGSSHAVGRISSLDLFREETMYITLVVVVAVVVVEVVNDG